MQSEVPVTTKRLLIWERKMNTSRVALRSSTQRLVKIKYVSLTAGSQCLKKRFGFTGLVSLSHWAILLFKLKNELKIITVKNKSNN